MLPKTTKRFNIIVSIICAVLLVAGACGFFGYSIYVSVTEQAREAAIREASEPLEYQKALYRRELNNLEKNMLESLPCGSTMTLVVLSSDEMLYTDLYPLLNATHELSDPQKDIALAGTVCFTPTTLPGAAGCITAEQYQEMREAGWSSAIYVSAANAAKLDTYLASVAAAFSECGMEMPTVAYFAKRSYSSKLDATLAAHGVDSIFHHEEDGYSLICQDAESPIWRVGCVDWNTKDVSPAVLNSILNIEGNVAFSFGFKEDEPNSHFTGDPMACASIDRMLDQMRQNVVSDSLIVADATVGEEKYVNYINEYNTVLPTIEPKKEELRALIRDIEKQLIAIYSGELPVNEEVEE